MAEKSLSEVTYETYLSLEAESDSKYEYHDGFIVAMAGGTPAHSQLGANIVTELNLAIRSEGLSCRVYNSDLKVRLETLNRTYYPDASVGCEEPSFSQKDPHALINPILIVEVLSASNQSFDRGIKFHHYRQLDSLKEYLLISQTEVMVDVFSRQEEEVWKTRTIRGWDASLELASLGCSIPLRNLYQQISGLKGEQERGK